MFLYFLIAYKILEPGGNTTKKLVIYVPPFPDIDIEIRC